MSQTFISKISQKCLDYPVICALFCGILSALALPFWNVIPLIFIGFSVFLYISAQDYKKLKSFMVGWAYGFGYFTTSLYWIGNAILVEADEFWWAYPFALFGLPLYLSLYYGLATFIAAKITTAETISRFFALLWLVTVLDFARGYIFTGFPWNTPGLIWINVIEIAQIAAYGGLIFLSALTFFWAAAFYVIFGLQNKRFKIVYTCCAIFSLLLCYGLGSYHINSAHSSYEKDLNGSHEIVIVQANIPQSEKWDPNLIGRNIRTQIDLTQSALAQTSKDANSVTVIWPETAIAYYALENEEINQEFKNMMILPNGKRATLLSGLLNRYEENGEYLYTNSLIGLDNGEKILQYNKHHLVPFGEYMPFQDALGWVPLVQIGGFEAGDAPAPITLPNGLSILPLICYEIIFPRHSFAAKDADFIINITNDGWYGNSAGPAQHMGITRFRAIEQGRTVIRAANTGISAMIDLHGKTSEIIAYGIEGHILHNYKFTKQVNTVYQKYNYAIFIIYLSIIFAVFVYFKSNYI